VCNKSIKKTLSHVSRKLEFRFFISGILLAKQPLNYKFISLDIRFLPYENVQTAYLWYAAQHLRNAVFGTATAVM